MTKEKLKKTVTITKKPGNNTCSKNELRKVERNKKYKKQIKNVNCEINMRKPISKFSLQSLSKWH